MPSLTFLQGLGGGIIDPGAMLKTMGASNALVGLSSITALPWGLKFIWSPLVDKYSSRRRWMNLATASLVVWLLILAIGLYWEAPYSVIIALCMLLTPFAATYDIASNGFFLTALDKSERAFFTGMKSTFRRLAGMTQGTMLFILAGYWADLYDWSVSWSLVTLVLAAIYGSILVYHHWALPRPIDDEPKPRGDQTRYLDAFKAFLSTPRIAVVLGYIISFRVGESILGKMKNPFLLDPSELGGMSMPLGAIGIVNGISSWSTVFGGVLAGLIQLKWGLRRTILPLTLLLILPNALFIAAAIWADPSFTVPMDFGLTDASVMEAHPLILVASIGDSLGYGMAFTSQLFLVVELSKGPYRSTYFAICSAIMTLGQMFAGMASGFVQESIGYVNLFITGTVLSLPVLFFVPFLPFDHIDEK